MANVVVLPFFSLANVNSFFAMEYLVVSKKYNESYPNDLANMRSMFRPVFLPAIALLSLSACRPSRTTQGPQRAVCSQDDEDAGQPFVLRDELVAQEGESATLDGVVLHDGLPVKGAAVLLSKVGKHSPPVEYHTTSDAQGKFKISTPNTGVFQAIVFTDDFHNVYMYPVDLPSGKHISVEVCLKRIVDD